MSVASSKMNYFEALIIKILPILAGDLLLFPRLPM